MEVSYLCRSCLPEYKCEGEKKRKGTECTDIFHHFCLFRNRNPEIHFQIFLCFLKIFWWISTKDLQEFFADIIFEMFQKALCHAVRELEPKQPDLSYLIFEITIQEGFSESSLIISDVSIPSFRDLSCQFAYQRLFISCIINSFRNEISRYSHKMKITKKSKIPYTLRRSNLLLVQRYFIHKVYRNEEKKILVFQTAMLQCSPYHVPSYSKQTSKKEAMFLIPSTLVTS